MRQLRVHLLQDLLRRVLSSYRRDLGYTGRCQKCGNPFKELGKYLIRLYNSIHVLHEDKELAIEIFLKQVWDKSGSNKHSIATSQCTRYHVALDNQPDKQHTCSKICAVHKEVIEHMNDPDKVYSIIENYQAQHPGLPQVANQT